ncbi:hypothetical protein [Myxococcus sp. CA040A]|uniref:hypothetical protein n=1 Tax=Myxococcus sp. CA040A TaxID=2741738 RepID=UPI00157A44C4|nr:hypothetical protein [Myxococcus sp. CA040A]NTX09025.1 hypothetical protein [Myxococcus sp. CA040A]
MNGLTGFDLSSLQHRDTATVDIRHPLSAKPLGIRVEVASADSSFVREVERELRDQAMARYQLNRGAALTAKEAEAEALELLVRRTVSWSGVLEHSTVMDCTPDNVRRLYTAYPWLRRQVDEACADRARFFEDSASSSSASPATNST